MDDEEKTINHKVEIEGLKGGMGWLFLAVFLFMFSFESEIRCALGNRVECVKMEPKPPKTPTP